MTRHLITAGDRTLGVEQIGQKVRLSAVSHVNDLDIAAAQLLIAALLDATHNARQAAPQEPLPPCAAF